MKAVFLKSFPMSSLSTVVLFPLAVRSVGVGRMHVCVYVLLYVLAHMPGIFT